MKPNFTPGPWHVYDSTVCTQKPEKLDIGWRWKKGVKNKTIHMSPFLGEVSDRQQKYNAALIAAAPEMYEILCDVLTDCKLSDGMRLEIERIMKKAGGEK